MRLLVFLFAAAFLFYVQATLSRMSDLCPDLGPVLAVYLGLFSRRPEMALGCAILGLLRGALDLEPAGVMILIYLTLALAASAVRDAVFAERAATQWIVTFAASALYIVLYRGVAAFMPLGATLGDNLMLRLSIVTLSATLLAPGVIGLLRILRVGP